VLVLLAYNVNMKDYYKILQIDPEANLEVMNNAYRTLVRQNHPDVYHTQRKAVMTERMQEINEAYQILSNATTRAEYDKKYKTSHWATSKTDASGPKNLGKSVKRILLWGVGTYVGLRFLVLPFLSHPAVKLGLLFALIFALIRIYGKRKSPSSAKGT
jgi:curved DNA-binding protein CbpA